MASTLYETDFRRWALDQAQSVRDGGAIDVEHVAEELETLGKSQEEQLYNRLAVLLAHILKWEHQEEQRSRRWVATIREQQKRLQRLIEKNPSLKPLISETVADAHGTAVAFAAAGTALPEEDFPDSCPYSCDELIQYRPE